MKTLEVNISIVVEINAIGVSNRFVIFELSIVIPTPVGTFHDSMHTLFMISVPFTAITNIATLHTLRICVLKFSMYRYSEM